MKAEMKEAVHTTTVVIQESDSVKLLCISPIDLF